MKQLSKQPLSMLRSFPKIDEPMLDSLLAEEYQTFDKKIVVLDDDPTGTQTVHGIPVYTDWETDTLIHAMCQKGHLFYILTNSRSFSKSYTKAVHQEIARNLCKASAAANTQFLLLSRGDSTLRGHYPLETEVLKDTLEHGLSYPFDGEIICPFFREGGRYTIHNVHYVQEGKQLTPAGLTEFAKDKTFGYTASALDAYIEEKSNGAYKKEDCIHITMEELRSLDFSGILDKLLLAADFSKIIVDAIDYCDVKVFSICWLRAIKAGKHYLTRCAASLVRAIGNIPPIPLLTNSALACKDSPFGGLVIIGSHVKKTSQQLEALKESKKNLFFLEFDVSKYFKEDSLEGEVLHTLAETENLLKNGTTVVLYTSRELVVPDSSNKDAILKLSVEISDALTSVVKRLSVKPKFIIAKGGITSSDVATKGLSIKKAWVMGQVKKGIPVWMTGEESKFCHMPYIIFPGNVGDIDTLKEITEELC